jgi:hypothetical protein
VGEAIHILLSRDQLLNSKNEYVQNCIAVFLVFFWAVYGLNNMEDIRLIQYEFILEYASNFLNCLLCLQYLAVFLLMIHQNMHPVYFLHILQSPDGERRSIRISNVSIQEAASRSLNCYYTQFLAYNTTTVKSNGHNKKVQLIASTEGAFKQLRIVSDEHLTVNKHALDCQEAARALFRHVIQPLQIYLKSTAPTLLSVCMCFCPHPFVCLYVLLFQSLRDERGRSPHARG